MTLKETIDGLYAIIGRMLFNSLTNEGKIPKELNGDDKKTYDACMSAIELLTVQKRLLHIAKAMHTWIFLHTADEYAVYDELGLTDEDNAMLGSIGEVVVFNQKGTVD